MGHTSSPETLVSYQKTTPSKNLKIYTKFRDIIIIIIIIIILIPYNVGALLIL
jgi:hypothetical protein